MNARFELQKSQAIAGRWFFHLRTQNGKIVLQSELYSCKRNALKGIEAIKRNAGAPVRVI